MKFAIIDYIVFAIYAITVIGIGLWVSREPKGKKKMPVITFWHPRHSLGG